jgi:hypothetical protein
MDENPVILFSTALTSIALVKILAFTMLGFVMIEIWRYHAFGEWMPNTVYAKRFTPYSDWSTIAKFFSTRWAAMLEPVIVLPAAIALASCAFIWAACLKRLPWPSFGRIHPAVWALALGCFLFGAIFGQNWGIPGRMIAAMLPFLVLALVRLCISIIPEKHLFPEVLVLLVATQGNGSV